MDAKIGLEERYTEAPYVNLLVVPALLFAQHLGRQVERRPDALFSMNALLQAAKVGNLVSAFDTNDILGLNVTMDEVLCVNGGEALGEVESDVDELVERQV